MNVSDIAELAGVVTPYLVTGAALLLPSPVGSGKANWSRFFATAAQLVGALWKTPQAEKIKDEVVPPGLEPLIDAIVAKAIAAIVSQGQLPVPGDQPAPAPVAQHLG